MTKIISISQETMLKLVAGRPLRPMNVPLSQDARIVRTGLNPKTGEFWVEVASALFEDPCVRLPQEFRIEAVK